MIDKRLKTIAEMVTKKGTLLDVGTDHGYLPIYLIKNDIVENAIASDVSKGSLAKAIKEVEVEKFTDKIQTRLGSGLNVINQDDKIETIVLAGMGGILISQLIDEKLEYIKSNNVEIIVQPVQSPETTRKYFCDNGFYIEQEKLAKADGKIYHIIKAKADVPGKSIRKSYNVQDETYYEVGFLIIQDKSAENKALVKELVTYKLREQYKIKENLESLPKTLLQEKYQDRYNEVVRKIGSFNDILKIVSKNDNFEE